MLRSIKLKINLLLRIKWFLFDIKIPYYVSN